MRVGSLFAGIGGFDEAFRRAGFNLAWHVEWDEACQRVLSRRFRTTDGQQQHEGADAQGRHGLDGAEQPDQDGDRPRLFSDVREVGAHNLPAVDVLVGGWPCQPVSVAGKRGASSDERDMWPEFARIAGELRPAWVVGENVPGVLTACGCDECSLPAIPGWIDEVPHVGLCSDEGCADGCPHWAAWINWLDGESARLAPIRQAHKGKYFARVVDDLTQLGYGVVWRTLDAQHFGVPQRRRRVFVVGCLGDLGRAAQVLLEPEGGGGDSQASCEEGPGAAAGPASGSDLARSLRARGNLAHREDAGTLIAHALNAKKPSETRGDGCDNLVTHTLRAEGHDASEDGTGRGTPIVTASFYSTGGSQGTGVTDEESGKVSPTLKVGSGEGIASPPAIVMRQREGKPGGGKGPLLSEDSSLTLAQSNDQTVFQTQGSNVGPLGTLTKGNGAVSGGVPFKQEGMLVRRLTPTECERLQGFPDGWTDGQPDSTRYRQLGNAVAVPCVEWIARRLMGKEQG